MPETSTLALIGRELARASEPLTGRLSQGYARRLFHMLGVDVPSDVFTPALETAIASAATAAEVLTELMPELIAAIEAENTTDIIARSVESVEQVRAIVESIQAIVDELNTINIPGISSGDLSAFLGDLASRAGELVIVEHLQGYSPLIFSLLHFFGIAEITQGNVGETNLQLPEYERKRLRFDRIERLLTDPGALVADLYGWGSGLDGDVLLDRLSGLLAAMNLPVSRVRIDDRARLEISLFSLTESQGAAPPGLDAELTLGLSESFDLEVPVGDGISAYLSSTAAASGSTGISIRPPADLSIRPPSGEIGGRIGIGFTVEPGSGSNQITLLGITGGTGLFLQKISAGVVAEFSWTGSEAEGDLGFEARLEGGKLKIGGEGADGFLADLLSGIALEADFDVGMIWTAGDGLRFTGSHGLTIRLPSHIDLGPAELSALTLTLGIDSGTFPITLATDVNATLGPLAVSVEQIGGTIQLSFPGGNAGNAGPVQIDGKFKPPRGAGLALDAGAVSGGGYLFFDHDKGEYGGALELNLANIVSVKAIGVIATQMPDGTDGFSLLIVITAEFGTGIQLGFGFTLLGVGGILGLNRSMNLEGLVEGVRSGSLDSVMFPTDVIANAQKIIGDLNSYFPVEEDTFVVGPLAKIGWGTPRLISLSLGVVIEIPPGNVAILGVLKVALPEEDAALIVIQVSFIGAIEFDKSRAWFFASLFGSRVLYMTIEGEMGVLVAWGSEPNFVVSVGGFHPIFQPPPLPFPAPRRVAVSILNESWGRIRVEGYFAVTPNTVQFGAKLDIFFGISGFEISGYLSLDTLFQFSPFYMIVDIAGRVSLKVAGIDLLTVTLKFSLEGPTPWRAKGSGSVKILFFKISARFDETWGDRKDTSLPEIPALPILVAELEKAENWTVDLPPSYGLSATLRQLEETDSLVLHPLGALRVSQRALPLGMDIDKVGNQAVSDARRFSVAVDSGAFSKLDDTREQYATGQYRELKDSERLSAKGYESQKSGLTLGSAGGGLRVPGATTRTLRYELAVIDSSYRSRVRQYWGLAGRLFSLFLKGSAVTQLATSQAAKKKVNPHTDTVVVVGGAYAVAAVDTNIVTEADHMGFVSQAEAETYLADNLDPVGFHVIEVHEARVPV